MGLSWARMKERKVGQEVGWVLGFSSLKFFISFNSFLFSIFKTKIEKENELGDFTK